MGASIKLNRRTKTIKVVNRRENIRLTNPREELRLKHTGKQGPAGTVTVGDTTTVSPNTPASVQNVGTSKSAILEFSIPQGQKGDTGETGVSTFVRSHHDNDATVVRPNALYVEWVGSIAPQNATTEDTWIQTPVIA